MCLGKDLIELLQQFGRLPISSPVEALKLPDTSKNLGAKEKHLFLEKRLIMLEKELEQKDGAIKAKDDVMDE